VLRDAIERRTSKERPDRGGGARGAPVNAARPGEIRALAALTAIFAVNAAQSRESRGRPALTGAAAGRALVLEMCLDRHVDEPAARSPPDSSPARSAAADAPVLLTGAESPSPPVP